MDPVDVLTFAVHAAQLIRSGNRPAAEVLADAYEELGRPRPADGDDPLAVRIARLVDAAEGEREQLLQFLGEQAGPLPLNRPPQGWGGAVEPALAEREEADAEAEELVEYVDEEEALSRDMMGDFPAFSVAEKRVVAYFGGRMIVVRDGERLTEEEAGEFREGDSIESEDEGLPTTVRGLIDYPLERPCLFEIELGEEPWSVWDVCCAFADQYARIYEHPEKYGIWGHDLVDLWIEGLYYFPEKRLIYPHVGS